MKAWKSNVKNMSAIKISEKSEPKKRKVQDEHKDGGKKRQNVEDEEETDEMTLVPVIEKKYFETIKTEKMFVGKIISKKETSRLVKELSDVFPLEGRSHLKRVKWTDEKDIFEIIIRPLLSNESIEGVVSFSLKYVIGELQINLTGLSDTVIVRDIPQTSAWTYNQFKEAVKFWPVQFRENKYIERALKDQLFSTEERFNIQKYMEICLRLGKNGDEKVGCVIVDPVNSKVVAASHDLRHHHPLQHAVMVAIELVAKSQGGSSSWNIESEHVHHLSYNKAEEDKRIAALSLLSSKDVKSSLPYLCTKYDLYVSREPCIMCAMALVHSRIHRVFYATETSWGALGSHWKLHLQDGLNHHYEVFKVNIAQKIITQNTT